MSPSKFLPQKRRPNPLSNERGLLVLDFVFALVVSIGFAIVFFSVAITLCSVEAGQYVTFATSRAYMGAHETKAQQESLARAKYADVMALSAFKTFYGGTWVKLGDPQLGDYSDEYGANSEKDNRIYVGARVPFTSRLLHMNVPFLGPTADDDSVGKATLNSYLMREVSTQECREQFNRARYQNLKNLNGLYQNAPSQQPEKLITDNGC
jgi:hypothetical protein